MRVKIKTTGRDGYNHTMITTLHQMRGGIYSEAMLSQIRKTILCGKSFFHTQEGVLAMFEVTHA